MGARMLRRVIAGISRLNLKWINGLVLDSNKLFHAYATRRYVSVRGKRCLVVGCSRGKDCTYFVRFGAREVLGIDIIKEIGKDFVNPKVTYCRTSCEGMESVPSGYYDLVFCFATMEHIPRIDLAFSEMIRVARPGGIIYAFSSPLWNSRYGHHRNDIFKDPWMHLRCDENELMRYCTSRGIREVAGHTVEAIIKYVFNSNFFNRVPAKRYIDVCNGLPQIQIIKNKLFFESPGVLSPTLKSELAKKGYTEEELLAVSHKFVARKLQ
jgi:SAM-dependent methyltransferase